MPSAQDSETERFADKYPHAFYAGYEANDPKVKNWPLVAPPKNYTQEELWAFNLGWNSRSNEE